MQVASHLRHLCNPRKRKETVNGIFFPLLLQSCDFHTYNILLFPQALCLFHRGERGGSLRGNSEEPGEDELGKKFCAD